MLRLGSWLPMYSSGIVDLSEHWLHGWSKGKDSSPATFIEQRLVTASFAVVATTGTRLADGYCTYGDIASLAGNWPRTCHVHVDGEEEARNGLAFLEGSWESCWKVIGDHSIPNVYVMPVWKGILPRWKRWARWVCDRLSASAIPLAFAIHSVTTYVALVRAGFWYGLLNFSLPVVGDFVTCSTWGPPALMYVVQFALLHLVAAGVYRLVRPGIWADV